MYGSDTRCRWMRSADSEMISIDTWRRKVHGVDRCLYMRVVVDQCMISKRIWSRYVVWIDGCCR